LPSFFTTPSFAAGSFADSVAVADFNGNGLRGNGDGTFQAAESYNAGNRPSTVVAGDFEDNGDTDLNSNVIEVTLKPGGNLSRVRPAARYANVAQPDPVDDVLSSELT
jgi:hypothetical protein